MSEAGSNASSVEAPPTDEGGDSEVGASAARRRGRPRVDIKAARKSRSKVRRVVPCYVDMGMYTNEFAIRYDAGEQLYDVTDVMYAAYRGRASSVNRAISKLTKMGAFKKSSGLWAAHGWREGSDVDKLKWVGARAHGDGRKMASHKAMPFMLQQSAGDRAGHLVDAIAFWIKRNNPDSQTFLDTVETRAPEGAALVDTQD